MIKKICFTGNIFEIQKKISAMKEFETLEEFFKFQNKLNKEKKI